jgi:uridine phosphorylase
MTFPYFSDKYKCKGTTSAIDIFLNSNNASSIYELQTPPNSCIICPSDFVVKYLSKNKKLKKGPKIIKPLYFLKKDLAIFTGFVGFGSPLWAWVIEQLIAYGIKNFIYIGFFGKVNLSIKDNKLFVIEKALKDEGTSYHYTKPSKWAYPNKLLTEKLLSQKGTVSSKIWTTDAMFKQTKKEINYANNNQIIGFDMETSVLFTVAKTKGCNIASIQIESDSFINNKWKSIYKTKKFEKDFIKAINLAIKVLDS